MMENIIITAGDYKQRNTQLGIITKLLPENSSYFLIVFAIEKQVDIIQIPFSGFMKGYSVFCNTPIVQLELLYSLLDDICREEEEIFFPKELIAEAVACSEYLNCKIITNVIELQDMKHYFDIVRISWIGNLKEYFRFEIPFILVTGEGKKGKLKDFHPEEDHIIHCPDLNLPQLKVLDGREEVSSLLEAKKLVIVGNGIEIKQMPIIKQFCHEIGAELGGTRSAVEKGLIERSRLIGISGLKVNPEKILLLGVSGSSAFMEGIKNSEMIIAVNKDERAMVFQQSDLGCVMDVMEFIEEWRNSFVN